MTKWVLGAVLLAGTHTVAQGLDAATRAKVDAVVADCVREIAKARQIQSEALKHVGGGAAPLGIWSRGCYWVESSTPTKVYKYGTYWKPIQCVG